MPGPRCRCGESHIAFALRACGAVGANVVHPAFWDDLLAVVASALRHHLAKTPEVSQRRVEAGRGVGLLMMIEQDVGILFRSQF